MRGATQSTHNLKALNMKDFLKFALAVYILSLLIGLIESI